MKSSVFALLALAALTGSAIAGGCSSPTEAPLGGPFGGAATVSPAAGTPSPDDAGGSTDGSSGSSSGGSSSGSPGGSSSAPVDAGPPPTWSTLYTKYLAVGTIGNCAESGCHSECSSGASTCYTWLNVTEDYIAGGINDNDLFSWTPDGFMPKNGPTSEPQAVTDFAAWTAAGSLNN